MNINELEKQIQEVQNKINNQRLNLKNNSYYCELIDQEKKLNEKWNKCFFEYKSIINRINYWKHEIHKLELEKESKIKEQKRIVLTQ